MQREVQKWLWDVRDACERIAQYVEGRTLQDYLANDMLRDAVEWRLSIIGEAIVQAAKLLPDLDAKISRLSDIIGFRNILIHDYQGLRQVQVWSIVREHLPILYSEVEAILPKPGDPTFPHELE